MRVLLAGPSCLALFSKALTIPVSNSVNVTSIIDSLLQLPRCSDLGPRAYSNTSADVNDSAFQDTGPDDAGGGLNFTNSLSSLNASLIGSDSNDDWHGEFFYAGKTICSTAIFVNAAHALAEIALQDLIADETFTVKNYNEAQIKVRRFHDEFTRRQAALGVFTAIQRMNEDDRFEVSSFVFFLGKRRMGQVDFMGGPCSSASCEDDSNKVSLPLVVPSNEPSLVASRVGPSQSAATTFVDRVGMDDSDMELDCQWHGKRVYPNSAMLAPSSALTHSHIVKEDPRQSAALRDVIDERMVGMTLVLLATPHPHPTTPMWTYFWEIKALGKMVEKMADRFDWREMTMTVRVDGFQLGTISLYKGIIRNVSGPSLPGNENGSILVT